MLSVNEINILKKDGFSVKEIMSAIHHAEESGKSEIGIWSIHHNKAGKMILLHPSKGGIYACDYDAHINFRRVIDYYDGKRIMDGHYKNLPEILEYLNNIAKDFILCGCPAGDYLRRKNQIEKLGYKIYKSNIGVCCDKTSNCLFLISK